ncbi:MAG: type VI secretion system baseplate subunit TssE [Candidatus Accumulibacter sp.]|jgi:type VI secretion system protein|nr:type VI secretion system baseplate subunit TssE [Accumulibacter sp.]
MAQLRLFERMSAAVRQSAAARQNGAAPTPHTGDAVLRSIRDYVTKLLNSREGSTLLDPEFGMPDFTHAGIDAPGDDQPALRRKIAEFISRNEPRLTNVQVIFAPREEMRTVLSFSIQAQLQGEGKTSVVKLYSDVSQQGKVDVWLR